MPCPVTTQGNLYYALTHSPEPLSDEYSYALSWKAATARFEAAACIPVDEAEQYDRWEKSGESGVEVSLGLCLMMSLALFTVKQSLSHFFCLLLGIRR